MAQYQLRKRKGSVALIVTMAVVIVILVAVVIYLVVTGSRSKEDEGPSPASSTSTESQTTTSSPRQVVDSYMKATLGTIPGAAIDYDKARELLTVGLGTQFVDASFVPMSYGIQDGPDKAVIKSEKITGNNAIVEVDGYWGDSVGLTWQFTLTKEDDVWKVKAIEGTEPL